MASSVMTPDNWLTPATANLLLQQAGYDVDQRPGHIAYRKPGVAGKITIHPQGVDGVAVFRLQDRGS